MCGNRVRWSWLATWFCASPFFSHSVQSCLLLVFICSGQGYPVSMALLFNGNDLPPKDEAPTSAPEITSLAIYEEKDQLGQGTRRGGDYSSSNQSIRQRPAPQAAAGSSACSACHLPEAHNSLADALSCGWVCRFFQLPIVGTHRLLVRYQ